MTDFDTLLVANRGEIAVRVLRSARAAGYRTVAVCSTADRDAPHVHAADEHVVLGPAPARESYLSVEAVIEAARATGAGAIHPGYGFLSENAAFARACAAADIVFVGPSPEAIEAMGDKAAAKRLLEPAGVPLLPGYQGEAQDDATLLAEAERIGVPLMVKAAAGGGGKGMRLVTDLAALPDALAAARREAAAAFGDDALLLERALLRPRHVEVQVLADSHGTTLVLGDRDCSVQRRHQKVVEEAPAPGLPDDVRTTLHDAARAAAEAVGYVGAGTVEFLVDVDDAGEHTVAFLEMNTRLQVEHPVTEQVTGLDLVDLQLQVASGRPLPLTQDEVRLHGHAIEVRLYAEDPAGGFLPRTGRVAAWVTPTGVRVDTGVATGSEVTAHYDPLLAKLVAHGRDRDEARRRLADAVDRLVCLGVVTNRTFLARVLRHEAFADGTPTTALLSEHDLTGPAVDPDDLHAVAGWWHLQRRDSAAVRSPGLAGFTTAPWLVARQQLLTDGDGPLDVTLRDTDVGADVTLDDRTARVEQAPGGVLVDGRHRRLVAHLVADDHLLVALPHRDLDVRDVLLAAPDAVAAAGAGVLVAPMHGAVVQVATAVGEHVAAGDPLVVVEAMKMEHVVTADVAGDVVEVCAEGTQVAGGDVLVRITPDDEAADDGDDAT